MGTFHHGKHELHGITVIVDTNDERILVGRCDNIDDEKVVLLEASQHQAGTDGLSKEAFVNKTAKFGIAVTHKQIVLPNTEVKSVERLGNRPVA